jgi:uncharacterized protein (DUF736 family)
MLQQMIVTRFARLPGTQDEKIRRSLRIFYLGVCRSFAAVTGQQDRHRGGLDHKKETNMILGYFAYDRQADEYSGKLITLTVQMDNILFRRSEKSGKREPDYRVIADTSIGPVEIGAAWKRTSGRGQEILSVKLDDPTFAKPVNAALVLDQKDTAALVWTR